MARQDQRDLIKKARMGITDGDKGTRALAREVKRQTGNAEGCLDYNQVKPYYRTALFEATWRNHEGIVKDLMNSNAQIDLPDALGRTPLHEASYYGWLNLVELFVDNKADINHKDNHGQTPLFRAVQGCVEKEANVEVVKYLIEHKAQTNLLDSDGCTVQHIANFNGDPEMSWWLFNHSAWKNRFSREVEGPPAQADALEGAEEVKPKGSDGEEE
jgi:ankyrin repeat protein